MHLMKSAFDESSMNISCELYLIFQNEKLPASFSWKPIRNKNPAKIATGNILWMHVLHSVIFQDDNEHTLSLFCMRNFHWRQWGDCAMMERIRYNVYINCGSLICFREASWPIFFKLVLRSRKKFTYYGTVIICINLNYWQNKNRL